MAEAISIREFARRDGCSDTLVRRALKEGRLTLLPDGRLDAALVGTGWRSANRRSANSANTESGSQPHMAEPVRREMEPQPHGGALKRTRREPDDAPAGEDLDRFVEQVLRGDYPTLADAERVKEAALALKHVLAARQAAGALVEIEVAETALFNEFRAARDAWLNWPARVGPLVAADLGLEADKVTEVLAQHVHQHLAELGEPEADFSSPAG